MTVLMRRLDRETARAILADQLQLPLDDLAGRQPVTDAVFTYSAVGGTRIGDMELGDVRGRIIEAARGHGYPSTVERVPELEASLAEILRASLPMTPNEASHEDAWSYLTCCWLLDVAVWRFESEADERRFIGNINRNTFRRLWWRAEVLGTDIDLARLGED